MSTPSDARSPVELLADEFLARCKRGERPTIREYCDRHPDLAEEIRDVFEAVLMVEDLKPGTGDASGSYGESVRVNGKRLDQVGDYRILCEIGRGGMGVVYEAEQQALGRRVALKLLPRGVAGNATAQIRFQREAKAAARMHHTNIVPVFDVGQDEDHLYYAMQLIRGQGLDLVVDDLKRLRSRSTAAAVKEDRDADRSIAASLVAGRFAQENLAAADPDDPDGTVAYEGSTPSSAMLPGRSELSTAASDRGSYFRSVARIGVQTASALAYAHGRGVVHRDIKPGNLILDTTGNVWVTDFGLAKTGDSAMTHTGDILGTVRYMSPERFRGQCDVRADVYALGVTLYELLTLKPVFTSGDRLRLIEMIRQAEAASPRSVDSRIPRDLETIVMKAIDKDPKRRYQSADEMGEDLQRFVSDEPIKARRVGPAERFTRWCRHHPSVAGLVAAVLVLMAAGTAVSTWQAVAATRARDDLAAKNAELAAEQAKVQARFDTAVKAVETFHTGVSEDMLLKNPEFKELRTKLLKEAARFYEELEVLLAGQTDAKSRKTLAAGYYQLAELTDKIGDKKQALAVHRKALAVRRELAAEPGADVETRLDVARSLHATGTLLSWTGDPAAALSAFQEQRDLAAALEAESPTDAVRVQLAFGHNGIGFVLDITGKSVEALDSYRQALAIYQKLRESGQYHDPGQGLKFGLQLQAGTHMSIGVTLAMAGKPAEGLESFRKASDIMQKLADANPANTTVQAYLANSYVNIGAVLIGTGKPEEALEPFRKALAIWQKLVDVSPAVTEFRDGLGWSHYSLGAVLLNTGKPAEALEPFRKALAVFQKLVDDQPAVTRFRDALARVHGSNGDVLLSTGKPAEALDAYRKALAIEQNLADANPTNTDYQWWLSCYHNSIGVVLVSTGKPAEALDAYRKALAIAQNLADADPGNSTWKANRAWYSNNIGRALDRLKRPAEAIAALDEGLTVRQKLAESDPTNANHSLLLGWNHGHRGGARARAGQPAEAAADLRKALELWAKLPSPDVETQVERARAQALLAGLGADAKSGVTKDEAKAFADRSVAALAALVKTGWALPSELKEPDFDALRGRDDFQKLVAEVEAKAEKLPATAPPPGK